MAHRLLSPRRHVDKKYYARVTGTVTEEDIDAFASGIVLEDGLECLPADLKIIGIESSEDSFSEADGTFSDAAGNISDTEVTIHEGKFHQIKRMFLALGHEVIYLKRLSMGPLSLDPDLAPGEYRRLTAEEIALLKSI